MNNYVTAIFYLLPNPLMTIVEPDNGYEGIEWNDDRPQPTKAECDAVMPQAVYEREYETIKNARENRYERETDGIFFDAMRADQDLTEWKTAVAAIKADLPYPTEPS